MSSNLTRRSDPLDDFFRGFFVRPVDFGGGLAHAPTAADAPQMRVDVREVADHYAVHAELPGIAGRVAIRKGIHPLFATAVCPVFGRHPAFNFLLDIIITNRSRS